MNEKLPDAFREGLGDAEARAYDTLWDALDEALPEPPTARMRRRLRRTLRAERLREWTSGLSLAGMATALVVGLVLGRVLLAPNAPAQAPSVAADLRLETQLLSGATTAARLNAIVNLREAEALPSPAAAALAGLVTSRDSSAGIQIAALEALLAHARQSEVQALIVELVERPTTNPMVEAMLRDVAGRDEEPNRGTTQGTTT